MQLVLKREASKGALTFGSLYVRGFWECHSLEDRIREIANQPVESWKIAGITAIPSGLYSIVLDESSHFRDDQGRPRVMPHLLNVPGFAGIRIHSGNTPEDTEGCILVGCNRTKHGISGSHLAYDRLYKQLAEAVVTFEPITIEIVNPPVLTS